MHKTVVLPGMWGEVDSEEIDEMQMSYGVATHRSEYTKVTFSGSVHPEGDVAEQTRTILSHKRDTLRELGGCVDDVTTLRFFVREDHLTRENQVRIHEVRAEFFESPHYPAATMVGVADLLHEDALVEIELEAEVPDDDWETEVLTGEDL